MEKPEDFRAIILAAGRGRRIASLIDNRPKSFLEIEGKKLIEHHLENLNTVGVKNATILLGYKKDLFLSKLGSQYKNVEIDYAFSEDFDITEHGWSLYLTKDSWKKDRKNVIFLDADNFCDPALLKQILDSAEENISFVDSSKTHEKDEEIVLGSSGTISGFTRGKNQETPEAVGEFVGLNKFSSAFMSSLYDFMDSFFKYNGPKFKYERVFDQFLKATDKEINYKDIKGSRWINVNTEQNYEQARILSKEIENERTSLY